MAKEAIKSIKDAEEEVRVMLQEATKAAVKSKEEAIEFAGKEYDRIIFEAEESAKMINKESIKEAELISQPIIQEGSLKAEAILSIKDDRLDEAVRIITRRVVGVNGNS